MKTIVRHLSVTAGFLFLGSVSAGAAVNLAFSSAPQAATNWLDASGSSTTLMVWGVIVDTAGDGFTPNSYVPTFAFSATGGATRVPQQLISRDGSSDDLLFISSQLMARNFSTTNGDPVGVNRINTIPQIPLSSPSGFPFQIIAPGDSFAIVWFNRTAFEGVAEENELFGFFTDPAFVIPNDNTTGNFQSVFVGTDPEKPMQYQLIPEPSAAILAAFSCALVGLRRRR